MIRILRDVTIEVSAVTIQSECPGAAEVEPIFQVDVEAADRGLEEVGIGLTDRHDLAGGVTRDQARELRGGLRVLQDRGVAEAAVDDLILEENPEGIEVDAQVLDRLDYRTQRVGLRLLRRQVGV